MIDTIRVIFCYRRMFSDGKGSAGFTTEQRLSERTDSYLSWYDKKGRKKLVPGGIYESRGSIRDNGTIATLVTNRLQFVGRIEHPDIATWELADLGYEKEVAVRAHEKKILADPQAAYEMEQLFHRYDKIRTVSGQQAFIDGVTRILLKRTRK